MPLSEPTCIGPSASAHESSAGCRSAATELGAPLKSPMRYLAGQSRDRLFCWRPL